LRGDIAAYSVGGDNWFGITNAQCFGVDFDLLRRPALDEARDLPPPFAEHVQSQEEEIVFLGGPEARVIKRCGNNGPIAANSIGGGKWFASINVHCFGMIFSLPRIPLLGIALYSGVASDLLRRPRLDEGGDHCPPVAVYFDSPEEEAMFLNGPEAPIMSLLCGDGEAMDGGAIATHRVGGSNRFGIICIH
jgi:hypothetical protein